MSELVMLRSCSYRHEAEVVRSVLAGHGIDAYVMSDDCGTLDPALGLVRGARVVVADEDVERANALLDAPDAPGEALEPPDGPPAS